MSESFKTSNAYGSGSWKAPQPKLVAHTSAQPAEINRDSQNDSDGLLPILRQQEQNGTPAETLLMQYVGLARSGSADAQLWLMRFYSRRQAESEALYWAQAAAEQNRPQAWYYLAQQQQKAVPPNNAEAHRLYRVAADLGLPAAHWQLGLQYRYGQAVEKDEIVAAEHFRVAAEQGVASAQTALAELLAGRDEAESVYWLEQAAQQGDAAAAAFLAERCLQGKAVARDFERARAYAQAAAAQKNAHALCLLGDIYRYGLGVSADIEQADRHYHAAAALGHAEAYRKLSVHSALAGGSDYQSRQQQALAAQTAQQHYQAGFAARHGLQREVNDADAAHYYRLAAEAGHIQAQLDLALCYKEGRGVAADAEAMVYWLERASAQGSAEARQTLEWLRSGAV